MKELVEIRKILQEHAGESKTTSKFIPTVSKYYGVKVPLLNKLTRKYSYVGFELVEKLWESRIFEEQLLAAKILGKICKQNPEKTLKLLRKFVKSINNWAVCDTLATQGIRKIAPLKKEEIFKLSKTLIKSKNPWQRRFALVLLINFVKEKSNRKRILEILNQVENDKNYYVRKAILWIRRCICRIF